MEEGIADVELDGDEDLLIAARDFKKVAESRTKVRDNIVDTTDTLNDNTALMQKKTPLIYLNPL